ncbi:hypothetical protein GCM10011611_57250 [Aliidongia dinghuensis]|uniref:YncE family protein n=2 Tax=Aliidongia dinghuensis TaxID=1867774 RepID=A0A8J2YZU2_9PROT|nr:hypothetical protein GCM10011611_57250 [Aliidongia dinghuensis]
MMVRRFWKRAISCALLLALAVFMAAPARADGGELPAYRLTKTVRLGGADHWDYLTLDAARHRLYIGHDTEVTVVDSLSGKRLGAISGLAAAQGVAVLPGRGYAASGEQGELVAFDLQSFKPLARIKTASDADAVVYDPVSTHLFVANGDSHTVTVVDPATNRVATSIDLGAVLQFAVTDGKGKIYVNVEDPGSIARIDGASGTVEARWPLDGCVAPHGLALDVEDGRLFASCANGVMAIVDAVEGKQVATLPIGKGTDAAGFDPARKLAFSANAEGTLSVIKADGPGQFRKLGDLKTAPGARTMAVDPTTGRIFLVTADVARTDPPKKPGAASHLSFKRGTVKLMFFDPVKPLAHGDRMVAPAVN